MEKVEFFVYDEADEFLHFEDANGVLRYEAIPDMQPPSGFRTFMEEINEIEKLLHHSTANLFCKIVEYSPFEISTYPLSG